jgi:glycosyltransferase involved in cell wall biosynthesis
MKWPFYRWFIPRLDACLPVGTWSKQYFQHYGAIEKNMVVVPHCIDDQHFSEQAQQLRPVRTELRQAFELGADQTVFLFVGKFIGIKRPMFFAEAVRRAARANSNIVGLMVGDGPLRTELEEFIAEKEVPIRLTGFLNQGEIARAYIAADALVVPSEEETWGLVVNEAMTCGLPCIVGDTVGCSPDLIRSGETGEIFSSDDLDSLVNLMKSWADQSEKLTTMGVAAKRLIASYSTEQAVQAMVEAVRTVQGEN